MQLLKPVFYTVAFLLEIGMLIAFFIWGFRQGTGTLLKYTFGIGAVILLAVFWGLFMSPKASFKISFALKMGVEVILFITAALILYKAGYKIPAIIFSVAIVFKEVLSLVYKE